MSERCSSTLICAERDKTAFEKIGYRVENAQAITPDLDENRGAIVMVDEEATNGRYDELTTLTGVPFLVSNGCCPGACGDHLIASDGMEWCYAEALHESDYAAVRIEREGVIQQTAVEEATKYWCVYRSAVAAIKGAVPYSVAPLSEDELPTNQHPRQD